MCLICGEIAGDKSRDLFAQLMGGEYERRVLADFEEISILPSVGPVVPGHVLLCPARHTNRIAGLTTSEAYDLHLAKEWARSAFQAHYGRSAQFFEHGGSADGVHVPCTVDHAHLHAVPHGRLWDLLPGELEWREVGTDIASLRSMVSVDEYLYYEDDRGEAVVACGGVAEFESQLLRRIIAEDVGESSDWNWRESPNIERLAATIATLGSSRSLQSAAR